MKEIVEEVLRVEEKAADILKKAQNEAASLRASSEAQASEIIARARNDAKTRLQQAVEKSRKEAQEKRKTALEEREKQFESSDTVSTPAFERAVTAVTTILKTSEYDTEL